MLSMAAEFALILGEIHPERAWVVEVVGFGQGPQSPTAPAPARELPWPDATEGEA
jgi:hypothetical protein